MIPFRETAAFRRFGDIDDPDRDGPEDVYLKAIVEEQGFDGLPHVVTRRSLDAHVRSGERELFRGVSQAAHADAFLLGDARPPLAAAPGWVAREDYEYVREGVCNLFLAVEPVRGWRSVAVTERRLPDRNALTAEVAAWSAARNAATTPIQWHFTTAEARTKLTRLYPSP